MPERTLLNSTRSSAIAVRPRDASCHWIFCKSLKVIRKDILKQDVCKPKLAFHCNCVYILYRFWDIRRQILTWPWNLDEQSFNIIKNRTTRTLGHGFLFAFQSNYGCSLYHFGAKRDIGRISRYCYIPAIDAPVWGPCLGALSEYCYNVW